MKLTFKQFCLLMDEYTERVPLQIITTFLDALDLSLEDIQDSLRFSDKRYRRNLIKAGSAYQILALCWKNGQRSPIHNHKGSSCGVKILKGVATETLFSIAPNNLIYPTNSDWLYEGDVLGSQDDDIHQISNLQEGPKDLISLHVYSPPLLHMDVYSLESSEVRSFNDPIDGIDGEGI